MNLCIVYIGVVSIAVSVCMLAGVFGVVSASSVVIHSVCIAVNCVTVFFSAARLLRR
jgi:hypothetical protein